MKCGLVNARSLRNKTVELCELIRGEYLAICCVTETWLKASDSAILAQINELNYEIISCPRKGELVSKKGEEWTKEG